MTTQLQEALAHWEEAGKQPGVLGRAAWSNVVAFRGTVAGYFTAMADAVDHTAPFNHYGTIEPHVRAIMKQCQPLMVDAYNTHARQALLLGANLEAHLQEADGGASASTDRATKGLVAKLDKLGLTGQEAVDYIIAHGGLLIKGMDAYTLKVMRSLIAKGTEDMLGVDGTVRLIRKEFRGMATVRARSIATTEMNDAMSEAAINKIRGVGLDGKRWIASPGACPLCQANKAQGIIPVNAPFQSGHQRPPGHPGKCRCAVAGARLSDRLAA